MRQEAAVALVAQQGSGHQKRHDISGLQQGIEVRKRQCSRIAVKFLGPRLGAFDVRVLELGVNLLVGLRQHGGEYLVQQINGLAVLAHAGVGLRAAKLQHRGVTTLWRRPGTPGNAFQVFPVLVVEGRHNLCQLECHAWQDRLRVPVQRGGKPYPPLHRLRGQIPFEDHFDPGDDGLGTQEQKLRRDFSAQMVFRQQERATELLMVHAQLHTEKPVLAGPGEFSAAGFADSDGFFVNDALDRAPNHMERRELGDVGVELFGKNGLVNLQDHPGAILGAGVMGRDGRHKNNCRHVFQLPAIV